MRETATLQVSHDPQLQSMLRIPAIPMDNTYRSCKLTHAYSCDPHGEYLLQL